MKKISIVLAVFVLVFLLCGCGKDFISTASAEQCPTEKEHITIDVANLAGTYSLSSLLINGQDETSNIGVLEASGLYCELEISENGSGAINVFDDKADVVFDGERMLMFTNSASDGVNFTYDGHALSFVYNGYELTFTK